MFDYRSVWERCNHQLIEAFGIVKQIDSIQEIRKIP